MPADSLLDIKKRLDDTRALLLDEGAVGAGCLADLKTLFRQQSAFTLLGCEPPVMDGAGTYLSVKGRCDTLFPGAGNLAGSQNISLTLLDCPTKTGGTERHAALAIGLADPDLYPLLDRYSEEPSEDLNYLLAGIAATSGACESQVVFSSTDAANITGELAEPLKNLANLFPGKTLQRGINFAADVTLGDDWLEYVGQILRQSGSKPGGFGVIYLKGEEKKPYLRFTHPLSGELELTSGTDRILALKAVEASFDAPLLPVWDDDEAGTEIFLGGRVALGDKGVGFDVTANVGTRYGEVALAIKNFPSLSELVKLAGGEELKAYFPDLLAELFNIQLSELAVVLNISGSSPSVSQIRCALTTGDLDLIPEVLSLRPSGTIRINAPFDAENREIEGELKVDGKIGETEIEGSIAFPSYAFHAGMKSGQSVSLLNIGKAIAPDVDLSKIDFAQISLTELDLSGDLVGGSFRAQIAVDTSKVARFYLAGKPYGITGIRLALQLDKRDQLEAGAGDDDLPAGNAGADKKWVAGYQLEGHFALSGTPIFISAQYDEDGWSLLGGIEGDKSLEVGSIIKEMFPDLSVPESLTRLKFANISFAAYLTAGDYSFSGRLEKWQPVKEIPLQFEVDDFSANYDSAGFSGRLSVVVTIPLREEGAENDIVIGLRAEKKPGEKGGWQFGGSTRQAINIDAMIRWVAKRFGAVSVPAAITNCTIKKLEISFNTESQNFKFTCETTVRLPETKSEIDGTVVFETERQTNGSSEAASYKTKVGGTLVIRLQERQALNFNLLLATEPNVQEFLATYHGEQKISIDSLLEQIFSQPITTGIELALKDALFAYRGDPEGAKYLFGINIGIQIGLAKLPVVGPALPASLVFSIEDLQILAATRAFTLTQVNALNKLMSAGATKLPSQKPDGGDTALRQGLNVSAKLKLAGADKLMTLPAAAPETSAPAGSSTLPAIAQPATPTAMAKAKPSASISKWFEIDKSLGPLTVRRIGLAFEAPRVGIKFDASLQLSFLTFNLEGLGLRYPLGGSTEAAEVFKKLEPTLDGMGLALGNGPIEIGGSLLRVPRTDQKLELEGTLLIRTAPFTFSALGSYVDLNGTISVMAFAVLLKELGDPTGTGAFVVTGLAFGFGVNRKLTIPPVEEVHKFPLIQAAMGKQELKSLQVLPAKLRDYVSPAVGNFWIAGGIKFNSFAIVDSFLLLSVSWGAEVEIGLLGLSRLTVPPLVPQDDAVAGAELALRGVIRIADGLIQFEARLTENSFIFSKACRLYGGFAFCVWFAGPNAGDFVVSLGGYHPAFARPAHYPLVRRLGMQLQIGTELCITGEAYFALTPSCVMAGGKLCAVFKSGGIEAWFIAYVDFLMNWQPFYYQAAMGISLGIALRLGDIAMRLEVSVDLRLQGPPFGGEARVVLWVISFTIPFGEHAAAPPPLKPREFVSNCLPAPKDPEKDKSPDVFSVRITGGLLREQEIKGQNRNHRIVNAHRLSLTVQSVIPCTEFEGLAKGLAAKTSCGIRPMGKMNLKSVFSVTADGIIPDQHVKVSAITGNVPDAVWGKSKEEGLVPLLETPERKTIEATLGIRMASIPQDPVHGLPAIPIEKFDYDPIGKNVDWAVRDLPKYVKPGEKWTNYSAIWSDDSVKQRRNDVLAFLRQQLPPDLVLNEPHLEQLSVTENYFQQQPEMNAVGY
jgi:hypothetical protein